jgi:hypothetical protein
MNLSSHWASDTRHTPTCVSGESGSVLSLVEGRGIEGPGFKLFYLCCVILYDTFGPSIRGLISPKMTHDFVVCSLALYAFSVPGLVW